MSDSKNHKLGLPIEEIEGYLEAFDYFDTTISEAEEEQKDIHDMDEDEAYEFGTRIRDCYRKTLYAFLTGVLLEEDPWGEDNLKVALDSFRLENRIPLPTQEEKIALSIELFDCYKRFMLKVRGIDPKQAPRDCWEV
jgi:hypothetical protein